MSFNYSFYVVLAAMLDFLKSAVWNFLSYWRMSFKHDAAGLLCTWEDYHYCTELWKCSQSREYIIIILNVVLLLKMPKNELNFRSKASKHVFKIKCTAHALYPCNSLVESEQCSYFRRLPSCWGLRSFGVEGAVRATTWTPANGAG